MHTEAQAKALWCPMVRHNTPEGEGSGSFNRGIRGTEAAPNSGHYHCCCIASACAMWRRAGPQPIFERTHDSAKARAHSVGYCGLAGKPEVTW